MHSDERGMTLIEILIAVAVMSVISVSIMGVFTAAAERSAEQNRRLIAASLARQKIAELRLVSRLNDMAPPAANFDVLLNGLSGAAELVHSADDPLPSPHGSLLDPVTINGTEYRFTAVFSRTAPPDWSALMAALGGGDALLRVQLTVSWSGGDATGSAARTVTMEAYVTDAG